MLVSEISIGEDLGVGIVASRVWSDGFGPDSVSHERGVTTRKGPGAHRVVAGRSYHEIV